jgi:hypothetical protein
MFVDPGAAQALIKQFNRACRKRRKPHGTIDHYHRGIRMTYTAVYRRSNAVVATTLLLVAAALCFMPRPFDGKPFLEVIGLRVGWAALVLIPILILFCAYREFVVVTDDGLIRYNPFGRETRMAWKDIRHYLVNADQNKVIFKNADNVKLTVSLAFDGWQDFLESAHKHLDPNLYWQLVPTLQNLDAKRPVFRWTKKKGLAKWFSSGKRR